MSKKNSSVILKKLFKDNEEILKIYTIFKNNIKSFKKKNSFLIAVSGGPDSLALAALAKAYSYEKKCKIYYILIDHNIRKESSVEAKGVKKLLNKQNISLNIIKNHRPINKNIQSQAREIRYDLLSKFCKKKRINLILTGHNLEDQVETFFIRLSRGSGLHGLSSMKKINEINSKIFVARPLLNVKKNELINISKCIFSKYYKDPSNENNKYLRTRIRKLKKILEKSGVNYDQIFKSIKNLASSRDTLDFYFNRIYNDVVVKKKEYLSISLKKFNNLNQEMKMRVVNKSIKELTKSYYTPRSKKTINLVRELEAKKKAKLTLGGCLILMKKNQIIIKKEIKIRNAR